MAMDPFLDVTIQGQTFRLKATSGKDYVTELASYVEGVMEEVRRHSGTPASHRIAVMAALQIADNLFQLRRQREGEAQSANQKVSNLIARSDQLLNG